MNPRAEQGDATAQFNLGLMNLRGEGSPPGLVEARRLFRLAAEQGHEDAQLFLGFMNLKGEGFSADPVEARRLCRLAAEQGATAQTPVCGKP